MTLYWVRSMKYTISQPSNGELSLLFTTESGKRVCLFLKFVLYRQPISHWPWSIDFLPMTFVPATGEKSFRVWRLFNWRTSKLGPMCLIDILRRSFTHPSQMVGLGWQRPRQGRADYYNCMPEPNWATLRVGKWRAGRKEGKCSL